MWFWNEARYRLSCTDDRQFRRCAAPHGSDPKGVGIHPRRGYSNTATERPPSGHPADVPGRPAASLPTGLGSGVRLGFSVPPAQRPSMIRRTHQRASAFNAPSPTTAGAVEDARDNRRTGCPLRSSGRPFPFAVIRSLNRDSLSGREKPVNPLVVSHRPPTAIKPRCSAPGQRFSPRWELRLQ